MSKNIKLNESLLELSPVDKISANLEFMTTKIENLVDGLIETYGVDIDLFYYCQEENQNVLSINSIKDNLGLCIENEVIQKITEFADHYKMMLSLNVDIDFIEQYEGLGFVINTNYGKIQETIVRYPDLTQGLDESLMMFGSLTIAPLKEIKPKGDKIQSTLYMENWYSIYTELLNSKDYKEKRKKETDSAFLFRKPKRKGNAKVGFAIVGKSKVA